MSILAFERKGFFLKHWSPWMMESLICFIIGRNFPICYFKFLFFFTSVLHIILYYILAIDVYRGSNANSCQL